MNGHMIWNDKRIAVRDVKDDAVASRMFYPADMFTFEPAEGTGRLAPLGMVPEDLALPEWHRVVYVDEVAGDREIRRHGVEGIAGPPTTATSTPDDLGGPDG